MSETAAGHEGEPEDGFSTPRREIQAGYGPAWPLLACVRYLANTTMGVAKA